MLLTLLVFGSSAAQAFAQRYNTDIIGTIVGVEGPVILIRDAKNNLFRADTTQVGKGPDGKQHRYKNPCLIEVSGKEAVAALQPGLALQVEATLENRRTVIGEPKKITLISATAGTQAGVLSAEEVTGEPATTDEPADKKTPDKKPTGKREHCLVVGQITKIRGTSITLAFPVEKGKGEMVLKLASDATVDVLGSNLSVVRLGDKIHAQGISHVPPHFYAREVQIEHLPQTPEKKR